ncbi:uncharacterized protein LOC131927427 [Physella acuta]|uniref:uncharacterized protein LOC131927427 n=1 Tax=Physella acuta TaxID=109671 RepID=UPI0027DBFDA4|nr:uncharacterized protein LOC131927427 [Physella acuta]
MMRATLLLLVACCLVDRGSTKGNIHSTKGKSGPLCGNKRHCLSDVRCSRDRQHCVCPAPLWGNGKLGCVKEGDGVIYLEADPKIRNLRNETFSLMTPCRYRILHYKTPDNKMLEVYADNALYKGGKYYVNKAEVRFHVESDTHNNLALLIEGKAEKGVYKFRVKRKQDEDSHWSYPATETFTIGDLTIIVSFDDINNFVLVNADNGFGFRLKFRPAEGDREFQSQIPGMVLHIDSSMMDQIDIKDGELSAEPSGESVRAEASQRKLDMQDWVLFLTMTNVEKIDSDSEVCDSVYNDFKNVCKDEKEQIKAIRQCSSIYNDQKFLKCVVENKMTDDFLAELYLHCQRGVCGFDLHECQLTKQKILEKTNCNLPRRLHELDCSQLKGPIPAESP